MSKSTKTIRRLQLDIAKTEAEYEVITSKLQAIAQECGFSYNKKGSTTALVKQLSGLPKDRWAMLKALLDY